MYRAQSLKPVSKITMTDSGLILTDGVNVRFVVMLPLPNYPKSHKIDRLYYRLAISQDTVSWKRHCGGDLTVAPGQES